MTDFQIWWEAFPKGDGFTISGKKFPRTRALRLNEAKCEKKFNEIMKKGKYTLEDLLIALNREVDSRMVNSLKSGENKMHFMSNSQAYLNGGFYEAWLEDDEEQPKENKPTLINPEDLF